MIAALAFGGTLFWVLMAAFIVIEVVSVFCENGVWSTAMIVVMLITLQLSGINLIGDATHHPIYSLSVIGGYAVIGIAWMFVKWWFFSNKVARAINAGFTEYKKSSSKTGQAAFVAFCATSDYRDILRRYNVPLSDSPLSPSESANYRRLVYWVSYWPLSFILTMLNDPIVRLMEFIVERCGGLLHKISARALNKINV